MAHPSVVVVGSCNIDLIAYMDRFPEPGETLFGHKFQQGFGGKGANQCVMAGKLSQTGGVSSSPDVAMVSAVGEDGFGRDYLANFTSLGIDTSHIRTLSGTSTGVAPIWVNSSGENCIVVVPGANNALTPSHVAEAVDVITHARVVLCQLEIPMECTLTAMQTAKGAGVTTLLTPAPAPQGGLSRDLLAAVSILIPNKIECLMCAGHERVAAPSLEQVQAAASDLLKSGAGAIVVTLGGDGALVGTLDAATGAPEFTHVPAVAVAKVVDTTGAGDAFSGALGYFYAQAMRTRGSATVSREVLVEAVRRACVVAADSVSKPGTQLSYASRADLPSHLFADM